MNNTFFLELNGKRYNRQQLIDQVATDKTLSDFEKSTLSFCHDWLTEKNEFTLTTSGSTGPPKIITLTRQQMEASARLTISALQLQPEHIALICLDTKLIAGQMMLVRSFIAGMSIVAVEPTANPFKFLKGRHVDFAAFVPLQVDTMLAEGYSPKLDDMKCAIIGGAPLSESLKGKLKKIKPSIFATYGMTETVSHVALQKLNGNEIDNSFRVLGNTKISKDERGCLVITTDYLDESVVTNDLVDIIDSLHFRWLGRIDNVINSGGVKISPEPVEKAIESIFGEENLLNRFFVAGTTDAKLGQRVVLFIEGENFGQEAADHVLAKLATRVSKFESPKELKFVDAFVETKSGKVNRLETVERARV